MQSGNFSKKLNKMDVAKFSPRNLRAATLHQSLHLPSVPTRYEKVPRRYEETKPALVQDFTHRKICDIGNSLYLRTIEKCNQITENAVREAEKTTWQQADVMRQEAVNNAIAKEREIHEKDLKKMHKIHEKHMKEEIQKVESNMQRMTIEQVQSERKAGEARLEAAVNETEEKCHQELLQAVQEAREEERRAASEEAERVARLEAEKLARLLCEANEEKERALKTLKEKMDVERSKAIENTRREEQKIATDKINELSTMFTNQIGHLKQQVRGRDQTIENQKKEIQKLEVEVAQIQTDLHDTRQSYQEFIDKTRLFDPGQSDYVIPPTSDQKQRPLTTKK